jgi:hypothetical protein
MGKYCRKSSGEEKILNYLCNCDVREEEKYVENEKVFSLFSLVIFLEGIFRVFSTFH